LLIHELATNAVKYGSLSSGEGRVLIETGQKADQTIIVWTETGGPHIESPPSQTGFGTQLSDISIVSQLGGELERDWRVQGLAVKITIPTAHL
jgi:two-component sensor histidine kinase